MSSAATISKRLHISFTPSVPALLTADLENALTAHFSKFATVKSVDGLGKSDGVGQARKFGYVQLEGGEASIARCEWLFCCWGRC